MFVSRALGGVPTLTTKKHHKKRVTQDKRQSEAPWPIAERETRREASVRARGLHTEGRIEKRELRVEGGEEERRRRTAIRVVDIAKAHFFVKQGKKNR